MRVIGIGEADTQGVRRSGENWNVAVRAPHADGVELCVFVDTFEHRLSLYGPVGGVFHGTVSGLGVGMEYGFRTHGSWDPGRGVRSDPTKLLVDPYALAVADTYDGDPSTLSRPNPGTSDSSHHVPRSVITDPGPFSTGRPGTSWEDTVIYEGHVRNLTMLHPAVPAPHRGTFLGVAADPVVEHLVSLGVTALELMPVAQAITEPFLLDQGLTNHWGYAPINYFAPWNRYSTSDHGAQIDEFRAMVDRLHDAGLEVIVDVVYNHTGEGGSGGPHLSFRGLDEAGWYRLTEDGHHVNWSGTGNTLDMTSPHVLRMTMDSLRWWVEGLGVDGFRFDLGVTLGRSPDSFTGAAAFFGAVAQDPVLRRIKLVAEPWDVGPDGYQVGNFPEGWAEWNDAFRDDVRTAWKDGPGHLDALATRLAGSRDRFGWKGPLRSLNLVTSHDGFTLRDVVSYDSRHNTANGEDNGDGHGDNRSWNSGVEGPTTDPEVIDLRLRRTRSMLISLLCAQGIPMLLAGDELGNTQGGNNNAYAQDNEISWIDWELADWDLVSFTSEIVRIRRDHQTLRRSEWPSESEGNDTGDVVWLDADGTPRTSEDWDEDSAGLMARYRGDAVTPHEPDLLLVFNTAIDDLEMTLPEGPWRILANGDPTETDHVLKGTITRRGLTALVTEAAG